MNLFRFWRHSTDCVKMGRTKTPKLEWKFGRTKIGQKVGESRAAEERDARAFEGCTYLIAEGFYLAFCQLFAVVQLFYPLVELFEGRLLLHRMDLRNDFQCVFYTQHM